MNKIIPMLLFLSIFYSSAYSSESVKFTGHLESVACAQACGICCSHIGLLSETNMGFSTLIGRTSVDLSDYIDDGKMYVFSGHFYQGQGQCNTGECTLFSVESVTSVTEDLPDYDSTTQTLTIPHLSINRGDAYSVQLTPPYNLKEASLLYHKEIISQFDDCSGPEKQCINGTQCITYFGIAGGAITFKECHIPCAGTDDCPDGQTCQVVVDGPGQVCIQKDN